MIFANHVITNASDLDVLPDFDVVICMSIFHHWVKNYGEMEALNILKKVAKKTKRFLIFDTGEPTEITQNWAEHMKFLGPSTDKFLTHYFTQNGFSIVENIGMFETNLSSIKRNLYIAKK